MINKRLFSMLRSLLMGKLCHWKIRLFGGVGHLKPTVKYSAKWYGSLYGGFYVVPEFLSKDSIVYSVGVGTDISFDDEIISRHSSSVYAFDPTPKSIAWIADNKPFEKFAFFPYGVGCKTEIAPFYLPKEKAFVSGSSQVHSNVSVVDCINVRFKRIKDIMDELGHTHIDVLKLDIEGAEYGVIDDIVASNVRAKQLLVEFHDRMFSDGRDRSCRAVAILRSIGYRIFAVSSTYEEVSFILDT